MSQARHAVENAAAGRRSAEEPPRSRLRQDRAALPKCVFGAPAPNRVLWGCDDAEAGGLPSSEAPPGDPLEAIGQRRVGAIRRPQGSRRRARESGSPLGARVVGRLQKSGRRIFPAAGTRSREAIRDGDGIARSDPPAFDEAAKVRGERQGAGRGRAREQQARSSSPGDAVEWGPGPIRSREPGPIRWKALWLVRLLVALNRRRAQRAWRGGALGTSSSDGAQRASLEARVGARSPRGRDATESVRGSHVRSGFLSRWAQEVGGRRWVRVHGTRRSPSRAGTIAG